MYDFFDTGIIVGTSYIKDIEYENFKPLDIDIHSQISYNRFIKSKNQVICSTIHYELSQIIKARRIMHKIILLELLGSDEELIQDEYINLALLRITERDLAWISDVTIKLKKYDVEHVYHELEEIRTIFELNIQKILNNVETFRPDDNLKETRNKIKSIINSQENKPNSNDITILSNAILYHTNKNKISFVSIDKGFNKLNHQEIKDNLEKLKITKDYPTIEILI